MADDIAVSVKGLSKDFLLPHERKNTLKETLLHFRKPTYERMHALKDINFEVKRGEFFGIVGRNGSGKSTMLKLLGGIYQPTAGEVKVDGTLTPFIELGIGFNPELTGRENTFLNGAILGLTRKEIEAKYDEIVAYAEIEKFMDQKLKNYSSGMQVRLAFSIAIQAHNDILLIDEVLAVGDADFQRKCFETFKAIKQSNKTVIFVSHDMGAIREYCDQVIMIEGGSIVSRGHPDKVANDYIQLFNKDASAVERGTNRWGDFLAEASDIQAKVSGDVVKISYKIDAHTRLDSPIAGVIIKDLDNNHIVESNNQWKKMDLGVVEKGKSLEVEWKIPNIFKTGKYKVTIGVAHAGGHAFYDWQEDAITFNIRRPEITAGLVYVEDSMKVTR